MLRVEPSVGLGVISFEVNQSFGGMYECGRAFVPPRCRLCCAGAVALYLEFVTLN